MDIRIIPCTACGGDKGHHDFAGHWTHCVICNRSGEEEIELEAITDDDLQAWLRHGRIGRGTTYRQEVERAKAIDRGLK